ncbi:sulfite exporter TauE/SafE family protein [Yoonia sp. 208BN28-4]|uniref:sulfite exporter TauE/SafE family protein n=1 Tax=Yoonia sp. 208BN28-4 TaxID=3126505 RepID=UPI0030A19245
MDGLTFWALAVFAAFCVGLGKGGVPVITALAVPLMSLVISPILAAGLLLPVFLAADAGGLYAYRKTFNRDVLRILMVVMPIGVFIGWATSAYVPEAAVTLLIGVIGASFAVVTLTRRPVEGPAVAPRWNKGIFWGTITGFTSFVSHSGATPYQVFTLPLRMDKITFAGTMTVAFAYINVVKLIPYYALGQLGTENLKTAAIMMIPAGFGVVAGVYLVRIIPEKLFFQVILWALLGLSLKLIWDGVTALGAFII